MPIDPSIPLRVNPPFSPMESYGKAMTLKNLMNQGKAQDIQLKLAEKDLQTYEQRKGLSYAKQMQELNTGSLNQRKAQLELASMTTDKLANIISTAKDPYSYNFARQQAAQLFGEEVLPQIPEQYDPNYVDQMMQQTLGLKDRLARELELEKFSETKRHNVATEGSKLKEVYDPNSPTGTRLIPEKEAAGKPGKPSKKFSITSPDGTVIEYGDSSGMEKRTAGTVEDKILNAGDTLSQLIAIRGQFKLAYQEIGTKAGMAWTSLRDRFDSGSLSAPEQQELQDYTAYRASAGQLFALTLKDLSGVAVNPTEFKRAEVWLPNPGTGIFDGDSPSQLKSKIDRFEDFTRKALAKYAYIQRNGLTVNDVDLNKMPSLINKRGNEIQQELTSQGLQGDELKQAVKYRLADEFGLSAY